MGIYTVGDILKSYPRDYTDYSNIKDISELLPGDNAVFSGLVIKKLHPYITRNLSIYKLVVSDNTDNILITIYNSQYVFQNLIEGQEYIFSGRIKGTLIAKECQSPSFIKAGEKNVLTPKYRLTAGISTNVYSNIVKNAFENCEITDELPQKIKNEYHLADYKKALESVHFPESRDELSAGKRRLAFEELLTLQLGMRLMKKRSRSRTPIVMDDCAVDEFFSALPFEPTGAQKRAVADCIADMTGGVPMNRLLQGDVGSGKTLVAAALCWFAEKNGAQSALMAPTEILAKQHYETLKGFLEPYGINVALLTGSTVKKPVYAAIKNGSADVIVGTHAIIQSAVEFKSLGLVITDEQHRFGVKQRTVLSDKGISPHTLVMSATPIPRTLAFAIYGDLDVSVLDEMPKGRIPIKTYGVDTSYRERIYKFIIKYISSGFQSYIVCPLVEESEILAEKSSAEKYYKTLKETYFSDIPIGLLHGKMKQTEKDKVMAGFKSGEIKLLISTTVIEVGVDVPNAVIMVIENAEQFGLSQLHQLRGRVGRGKEQSHCILITDSKSEYTKARIDTMLRTTDGFEIANEDLKLRGPGNFFGAEQHGLPALRIADMSEDTDILQETRELTDRILSADAKLSLPENSGLRKMVGKLFSMNDTFGVN